MANRTGEGAEAIPRALPVGLLTPIILTTQSFTASKSGNSLPQNQRVARFVGHKITANLDYDKF